MQDNIVRISTDGAALEGRLVMPDGAGALILFVHGSGSSRFSKRNDFVAGQLQERKLGTLLFDLLTEEEDRVYENRFDIELITGRILAATRWVRDNAEVGGMTIGYFGASTGSAAAIKAAVELQDIAAVVSRGGRPDLVIDDIPDLKAPTLLIVGGNDHTVLDLNQKAYDVLGAEKELTIVPGATHLFEEKGALEQVAEASADWFEKQCVS